MKKKGIMYVTKAQAGQPGNGLCGPGLRLGLLSWLGFGRERFGRAIEQGAQKVVRALLRDLGWVQIQRVDSLRLRVGGVAFGRVIHGFVPRHG